ncbi:PLP-dependent transferase [Pluteus cervinus]|uniref:PLP-dependent transferase n=1 Tax=Pluteus cervinus TaxID=181527 RepID=A0ACD3B5T4_9AGAR|nr:PLP-dependent transferase [Pluteus cervinus]
MGLLFKNLRIHQVFGANTDVGKTIITTALVRASATRDTPVFYLKPVSTGAPEDADDEHIHRHGGPRRLVTTRCLHRFSDPVSPHLAAARAHQAKVAEIPSDSTFTKTIANYIQECAGTSAAAHMYIETAGGVHSPTLSGTSQVDTYRPLFLPTILVGDSKLGGISTTISAYESLLLRGYIIDAVLLFGDEYYRNWEYLTPFFSERGVHISVVPPPPPRAADVQTNTAITDDYYTSVIPSDHRGPLSSLFEHLEHSHTRRLQELISMPKRALSSIWWPFVQHSHISPSDVTVIDSAYQDFFSTHKPATTSSSTTSQLKPEFDGSASWWTQAIGHAHPSLTLAAASASGRYGHVLFPQAIHSPALKLAEWLVHEGPGKGWASRAFFSDNGSTGMEVALKMALRKFTRTLPSNTQKNNKRIGVIGLKGNYHGDTIGAMDACEEGVYSSEWHDAKGFWFESPEIGIRDSLIQIDLPPAIAAAIGSNRIEAPSLSWIYDVAERLNTPLADVYRRHLRAALDKLHQDGRQFAALVLEPLLMGAGGMIFVDPLFQRILVDVVRETSVDGAQTSVIFDEVFVGLYRLGLQTTAPTLGVKPDISVHAKILTGGLVPLSITLASEQIFKSFLGSTKAEALLHGHSYTAHPIGCEVANQTIQIVEKLSQSEEWKIAREQWKPLNALEANIWSFWDPNFVNAISALSTVDSVMTLGSVLALKLDDAGGYVSHAAHDIFKTLKVNTEDEKSMTGAPGGLAYSVNFRTLGNVAYFMTSLNTPADTIRSLEDKIWDTLKTIPATR